MLEKISQKAQLLTGASDNEKELVGQVLMAAADEMKERLTSLHAACEWYLHEIEEIERLLAEMGHKSGSEKGDGGPGTHGDVDQTRHREGFTPNQ